MKTRIYISLLIIFFTPNLYASMIPILASGTSFTPPTVSASVGDTIRFTWVNGFHTTTCDGTIFTSLPPGATPWHANLDIGSPVFFYIITVAGTYNYKCAFHAPTMVGVINAAPLPIKLNLTSIIEGFWNGSVMVSDTVKVYLHRTVSPFVKADSASVKLNTQGSGLLTFTHAGGGSYYLEVTHRNALETWSTFPVTFPSGGTANYDFTTSQIQAYGANLKLVGTKYTFYSGDVNQDDFINLDDILSIYNNAAIFLTGYVVTDVNGDNITDLADILIALNNSNDFISVKRPPVLLR